MRVTCPTPNFPRASSRWRSSPPRSRVCAMCWSRCRRTRFAPRSLQIEPLLDDQARIAWASKGFEMSTGLLPHQVAREVFGPRPGAVLSGPTFAREVGAGLPTAMTVASRDADFAKELALRLSGPEFRAYTQSDIVGVEVGGAVKNVIAIGSGIADGMGFGANTRVALITRGLAEMTRLGLRLGAQRETFMGLAALGDLVLDLHRRSIAQPAPRAGPRPRPFA